MPTTDWHTYAAVQAGAAATLTGLMFVAVSMNLNRIMSVPGLPGRAVESVLQLLQIFFISSFVLIPGQVSGSLGTELLLVSAVSWGVQAFGQILYERSATGDPRSWLLWRAVLTQLATIPFFVAGGMLLAGNGDGLYWLVPGCFFSFAAAVTTAWMLLIEILR